MSLQHPQHPEIVARLKRAEGHLRSTILMIEQEKACLAIAQQLQAVESAISKARKLLVQQHVDHCLEAATGHLPSSARKALQEFKAASRYL
jgi:DNA-binding FrmR family transcriptional regulator